MLFLSLFFAFGATYCGAKSYNYAGWIEIQGSKIDFSVSFTIAKNNLISGTSVTAKGTDDETNCRIKGKYNSSNGSISFYETVVLSSKAKRENLNFCLLSAQLKRKETETFINYRGTVTGYVRGSKIVCGNGKIFLEMKKITHADPIKQIESSTEILLDTLYSNLNSKKLISYEMPGKSISLSIKDDIKADGDIVTIYFDGKPVLQNYTLTEELKTIELNTASHSKKHILKIVANNEGMASPNTSRIILNSQTETKELTAHIKKGQAVYIEIKQ